MSASVSLVEPTNTDLPVGRHFASSGHSVEDMSVSVIRSGFRRVSFAGHGSQVTGHRSRVTGHRSRVTGHFFE